MTIGEAGRVDALVAALQRVDEEMRGMPIHNPALAVEAVGFRPRGEDEAERVGVLVTPWFISLILLPADPAAVPGPKDPDAARKAVFPFPSGDYAFLPGEVGEGLRYWSCHLFSPVAQFSDQQTAREAAAGALDALFTSPLEDSADDEGRTAEPEKRGRRSLLGRGSDKPRR